MTHGVDLDRMGPIDFVVIEFPQGRPPDGSAFRHLTALVRSGLVRILDLRLLRCLDDGELVDVDIADAGMRNAADVARLAADAPGLLAREDVVAAGAGLTTGSVGAVIVFENCWAAPFATTLRQTGALLIADRRVPIQAFLASLAH